MTRTLFSVALLVAAIGIFVVFTKPAYDDVKTQQDTNAQYDAALAKAAQLEQIKQTLLSRYNSFNPSDLARLQAMVPDHVDNIGLILNLDSVAGRYSMPLENVDVSSPDTTASVQEIQPTTPVSGTAAVARVVQIGTPAKPYEEITIKFSTAGTYASFQQFMTALQESLRVVDMVNLSISNGQGPQNYQFDVTLRTYWLKTS